MSDCANGGRFPRRWTDQVWHAPDGREVHVPEGGEPCAASLAFADGTTLDMVFERAGREVVAVTVDGVPYRPDAPDERWELADGRIAAIVLGGARFERADKPRGAYDEKDHGWMGD